MSDMIDEEDAAEVTAALIAEQVPEDIRLSTALRILQLEFESFLFVGRLGDRDEDQTGPKPHAIVRIGHDQKLRGAVERWLAGDTVPLSALVTENKA